jgi:hypothetical protein
VRLRGRAREVRIERTRERKQRFSFLFGLFLTSQGYFFLGGEVGFGFGFGFGFLRQALAMQPRLAWNWLFSCLSCPSYRYAPTRLANFSLN